MMNKSTIEWCDYTWNPITGCLHNCEYCYARRFAGRGLGRYATTAFRPTFHPDRLCEPAGLKTPSRIFVGSMGDLFGNWKWSVYGPPQKIYNYRKEISAAEVQDAIAIAIYRAQQHTYICLTKATLSPPAECNYHPGAAAISEAGAWIGVSVTGDQRIGVMATEDLRIDALIRHVPGTLKFVSLEPFMDGSYLRARTAEYWAKNGIKWVIIGGMTGPSASKYPKPDPKMVIEFVDNLKKQGISVFVKDNLGIPELNGICEYPKGMVNT